MAQMLPPRRKDIYTAGARRVDALSASTAVYRLLAAKRMVEAVTKAMVVT